MNQNKKLYFFKNGGLVLLFFLLILPFSSAVLIGGQNIGTTIRNNITNYINGSNINASSTTCSGTDKFSAYDNATGVFTCSTDQGGVGSADGNNYTTAIAFTGGSTKTLNLARFGMANITATFDDNEGTDTNNYPTSLAITNGTTHTVTIGRNGLSDLVATFFDFDNDTILNETTVDIYVSNNGYLGISTLQTYFTNGTNVNASSLASNLSAYSTTTVANGLYKALGIQTWNDTHATFNKTYADTLYISDGNTNWDNSYGFTTTNLTTTTCSAGQVVTAISNLTGVVTCSSMPTVNTSYALQTDLLNYNKNGTHINQSFADGRYLQSYTETDPLWTANRSSYSTTTQANSLYKAIGIETYNSTANGFNETYANTKYKALGIETYNSTNFIAGQNYLFRAGNVTCGIGDVINGFNNTTGTFNCITTPAGTEADPHWTGNISSYFTKTNIQNYFDNGTNVNASSLASNLSAYSTTTVANGLYKAIGIQTWNDTQATFNKTYADTLYYSSTNPSNYITDGNTNWDNSYGFTTVNASSITCPAGDFVSAYSNLTGVLTCTTPSVAGDNTSWSENRVRQLLNSTQFDVTSNQNFTIKESWLDTIYAKIVNYFSKTDIQNYFNNGTNVNASSLASNLSAYSTTTVANGLYKAIGVETWNSTHSNYNKTYGDTLYYPISANTLAYWNSTFALFNKTYGDTLYKAIGVETWNSTYSPINLTSNQTFTGNLTVEGITFEADTNHRIVENTTCITLIGDTSRLEIC